MSDTFTAGDFYVGLAMGFVLAALVGFLRPQQPQLVELEELVQAHQEGGDQ